MQAYDLKIVYTPGKSKRRCRTLSRPPGVYSTVVEINISIDLPSTGAADTREAQLKDPQVGKIIQAFEGDDAAAGAR